MNTQRRLGRGLEALLGQPFGSGAEGDSSASTDSNAGEFQPAMSAEPMPSGESVASMSVSTNGITHINVHEVDTNPFQPRRDFDEAETESLAQSIRDHGLIQPVVVRSMNGRFQLIAGERRLRAAIKAGWNQVPAQVREADDRQVAEVAIIENLQRKDLNALEKAGSFQQYLSTYGCTQEELAARLSVDRSTIANLIRLLELPEAVRQAVASGAISAGHARALLPLGDEQQQVAFCERIQSEQLSVRAIEQLVAENIQQSDAEPLSVIDENGESHPVGQNHKRRKGRGQLGSLEQELKAALGTKVQISQTAKGKGKIVIHFANHDEFERIRGQITHQSMPHSQAG
jgi:ParB family chromosome partitioning protein